MLLVETVRKVGSATAISAALMPWRQPRAVHDPGRVLLDVALTVALGGDCLADAGMLRAEPAVSGPVASDPTVSRLIDTLAASEEEALAAVRAARAKARARVWKLAGERAPDADGAVTVDLDGGAGDRTLGQGGRRTHLEANLRPPPADGVRRPRAGRYR